MYGQWVTATATDLTNDSLNTSEFSAAIPAGVNTKHIDDGGGFVVNTTASGIPLHWPDGRATYMLSTTLDGVQAQLINAINEAFGNWNQLLLARPDGTSGSLQIPMADQHRLVDLGASRMA